MAADLHELYRRWRRGDRRSGFWREVNRLVVGIVRAGVPNFQDAKDVAQDTLVALTANIDCYNERRPLRPWLYTFARNRVLSYWRDRKRSREALGSVDHFPGNRTTPGTYVDLLERAEALREALHGAPTPQRYILEQRLAGRDHNELAQELEISPGTSRARQSRATRGVAEHVRQSRRTPAPVPNTSGSATDPALSGQCPPCRPNHRAIPPTSENS